MKNSVKIAWALLIAPVIVAQASQYGLQAGSGAARKVRSLRSNVNSDADNTTVLLHALIDGPDKGLPLSAGGVAWTRVKEVYCSDNWDLENALKAKDHGSKDEAGEAKCQQECLADASCIGVSVTNANWGNNTPWCHLCKSITTKPHQNFDTLWREDSKPLEVKERQMEEELTEIKNIEHEMCRSPQKVKAAQLKRIQAKAALKESIKANRAKIHAQEEDELKKLKADQQRLEENHKKLYSEVRDLKNAGKKGNGHTSTEKLESALKQNELDQEAIKEKIEVFEVVGPKKILQDEEKELETDIQRIERLEKELAKEREAKEKLLATVRSRLKVMDDKEELDFWNEWLGGA